MSGIQPQSTADPDVAVVSVLVVDDQEPFLAAARYVVSATSGFRVTGEARSGEDAVQLTEAVRPDLVLMDINLPGISGIEATRRLLAVRPETVVVLMSTYPVGDLPGDAASCGARAYVHKEDLAPDVLVAVVAGHQPSGLWTL